MKTIINFFKWKSAPGILLVLVSIIAIILENSSAHSYYELFKTYPLSLNLGLLSISKELEHWVNDGLMAIFFLLVGLEIKREILQGELSSRSQIALPGLAALGGMIVPALIYVAIDRHDSVALRGWAIPAATDIAFALGVLNLLGKLVPVSLKVFLTALAIIDDLGAILIIAFFYTEHLSWTALDVSFGLVAILYALNKSGVRWLSIYLFLGLLLWFAVLKSGIHATLAGVLLAFTIPLRCSHKDPQIDNQHSPLLRLEHALLPWVNFMIVPLFGFTNAGVSFAGVGPEALFGGVSLGIALGLFLGKQIGVFGFSYLVIKTGFAQLPKGATWKQLYGVSLVAGIGFTMSLFIGNLAFGNSPHHMALTRIGVLVGSLTSALTGALFLYWVAAKDTTKMP